MDLSPKHLQTYNCDTQLREMCNLFKQFIFKLVRHYNEILCKKISKTPHYIRALVNVRHRKTKKKPLNTAGSPHFSHWVSNKHKYQENTLHSRLL